jgi:antitoxin component YwqK of YwqJK toxin-antitoxin module
MKIRLLLLLCCVFLVSCKTKINQYVKDDHDTDKRNGKWREEYSSNDGILIATGKYKKGEKIGTWKIFSNDELFQKDKIRRDITKTKRYFPNGRIMEKGQSKLEISEKERHWFYFGDWKFYNDRGELLYIKKYFNGNETDSISFKK